MRNKLLIALLLVIMIAPLSASAFWFWDKPAAKTTETPVAELNKTQQEAVAVRYKLWAASFEKRNIETVIANQDNFWFTVPELNYLFASETKKQKNPIVTDLKLNSADGVLNISANFKQIFPGRFSFQAQVVNDNDKAHLNLSQVKLYGWTVPSSWLNKPLNKTLDEYFSFLYNDKRYAGFTFSDTNGVLKLKPEFK